MTNQQNVKAHFALLSTNLFFAINFSAIKFLLNNHFMKPFGLNFVRVLVATLLLWVLYFFKKTKTQIDRKDMFRIFLCGLMGIATNQMLFIKGLSYSTAIHGALLMLTTPILITILAAWLLKERHSLINIIGLGLGIGGACFLVLSKNNAANQNSPNMLWGDILLILNAVAYSIYFILVKPLMNKYSMVTVLRMAFTFGLFIMIPFCWTEFSEINWQQLTSLAWLNLALIVVCGTFLAYLFNIYGIDVLGASVASAYIYLQPIFAGAIAMIFLGEPLTTVKITAGFMIAAGVYLVNKKKR